ncbi:MAG: LacI family DNA-binding transcriptional regulator [Cytophagales bacterium]|nr:LacI family DNA-binding transcriptional regulator [Armatimonadota bacterium]
MRTQGNEAPITAKEIGRRLGLSQPTVSRILSGASGHRVSPETRRRVVDAASQMGYQPNALARSLRQGRTNIVGFYTGYGYLDARNPFLAELIGGLQRAADPRRLDILLHGVFRGASTDDIYGELVDGRIDGLFLHTHADDPLAARLRDSALPVVALADTIPGIPSIVADDAAGTSCLLEYLWDRGHRRIGYLRPSQRFASVERRLETFHGWTAERGLSVADTPIYEIEFEATKPALEAILAAPNPPSAVCCWNDTAAFDLLYHCRNFGVRVPDDLAVVGFDGLLADPRLCPRALVTVGASWTDIADRAMDLLMQQIRTNSNDSAADTPPLLTRLPVSLAAGDTA